VLLRRIQQPHFLKRVSHIVLDEVHERGVETDFLMTILKQQMKDLPSLRVILMSATMQEDMFR
jgi:ATP-dependent RNA helicase DHX57